MHYLKGTDKTWVTVDNTGSAKKSIILASKESNIIYNRSENLEYFQSDQFFLILSLLLFTNFWYAILPLLVELYVSRTEV